MMIKLFVSDIDGCLSEPYRPFALDHLRTLAQYIRKAGPVPRVSETPPVSLLSARSYSYVEAMTQVLGVQVPVLFESGGGMFDPQEARVLWNPLFTDEVERKVEEVRRWMVRDQLPGTTMLYDYGKRTGAGVVGPDREEVARFVPKVEAFVSENFPDLRIFYTSVSVEVVSADITKRQAIHWLASHLGIDVAEMAYIGDTNGDLEALQDVGYSFAPANATPEVKAVVKHVTQKMVIEGVLEAYQWCMEQNSTTLVENL